MKHPLLVSLALHVGALVALRSSAPTHRDEPVLELAVLETARPASPPPGPAPAAAAAKDVPRQERARSTGSRRRPAPAPPPPEGRLEPTTEELATAGVALRRRTGAHWTLSLRLDRLRASPLRAEAEPLVARMPMLGAIAAAIGRDALDVFDTVQISSIAFGSHGSTVWVARHRLGEGALVEALTRAARDAGVRLVEGRLWDVPCFDWPGEGAGEVLLVAAPDTIVVVDATTRDAARASGASWDSVLPPVELDDGPSPPDAVAIFSSSWAPPDADRPAPRRAPARAPLGRSLPPTLTAVLELDPRPTLDVVAEFADDAGAGDWERGLQPRGETAARASAWPTALMPLVDGAPVRREGRMVRVHEALTVADLVATLSRPQPARQPFAGRQTAGLSPTPPSR